MRPTSLYKILDEWQSAEWFSKNNKTVKLENAILGIYNDPFLSDLSQFHSSEIKTVIPLTKWTFNDVSNFLIGSIDDNQMILSDPDCLGFGKEFWIEFAKLAEEKNFAFSVVTRSSFTKFTTKINTIYMNSPWKHDEIVYTSRILFTATGK